MSYFQESGLYYLQSRYYNPEVGRFLNADAYASTGQGLLGNNMFAYCRNNPVDHRDESGEIPAVVWGYLAASTVCGITNAVPVFRNDGSFIDGLKAFGIGMLGGTAGFGTAHLMKFTPQGAIIGRGVSTAICDVGTAWALTGKITEGDIALVSIASIEKLTSGWRGSRAEVSFAKSKPEVTFTNIFTAIDLSPPVTYNINALLMRRIGQR